jgi:hypothetical protein
MVRVLFIFEKIVLVQALAMMDDQLYQIRVELDVDQFCTLHYSKERKMMFKRTILPHLYFALEGTERTPAICFHKGQYTEFIVLILKLHGELV